MTGCAAPDATVIIIPMPESAIMQTGGSLGVAVVRYHPESEGDLLATAPFRGVAMLSQQDAATPLVAVRVERGEPIGFRDYRDQNAADGVVATVGETKIQLNHLAEQDRPFIWHIRRTAAAPLQSAGSRIGD